MRRRELTNGVTHQEIRTHTPALEQSEQRDLQSEQSSLGIKRLIQEPRDQTPPRKRPITLITRQQHFAQWVLQMLIKLDAYLIQRAPKNGKHVVQLPTHTHALGTLTREQERQPTIPWRAWVASLRHACRGISHSQGRKTAQHVLALTTQDHRTVLEQRASNGKGVTHVYRSLAWDHFPGTHATAAPERAKPHRSYPRAATAAHPPLAHALGMASAPSPSAAFWLGVPRHQTRWRSCSRSMLAPVRG